MEYYYEFDKELKLNNYSINKENLIDNIEKIIAFLPNIHIGTTDLEIMLKEYKKEKEKIEDLEDKIKKAIDYMDEKKINSITRKELLKILEGDVTNND